MSLPQNVISVTTVLSHRIYRSHGITVNFSPSPRSLPWLPRYYRFPHYRLILYCTLYSLRSLFAMRAQYAAFTDAGFHCAVISHCIFTNERRHR